MKIDYEGELNPAQLEAVRSIDGPHLVIAGAGSGKTRILVYRVAYLVEQGIKPDEILLLTFTRKAAGEMLSRSSLILDDRCQNVSGGTFHSFANMILRRYGRHINLPANFTILDASDAESAVNLVRADLGFGKIDRRFPKKRALLNIISKSVNKAEDITQVTDAEYPHFLEYSAEISKIKDNYIKYKQKNALLDYDDLLVYLKNLLSENNGMREKLSARFKYIMVDEYQDTNKLQAEIIYLLLCEHDNIMVVGDDSQSIYSFRGANFRNIIDFPRVLKNTRIITLEENYRSVQPILDLTNKVIAHSSEKFEKILFTKKKRGSLPVYIDAEDENSQSGYIVQKLLELTAKGVSLSEIAVLFRAGWHSNDLEIELTRQNIPFLKYGGQRFVEAAHVKDLISHMRIAQNRFDEISWRRALLLIRGVGQKSAERIVQGVVSGKGDIPLADNILKKAPEINRLNSLLKSIDKRLHSPAQIVGAVSKYYEPLLKENYDDFHKRAIDLDSLARIAARYTSLEEFLVDMALEPPEKSIIDASERQSRKDSLVLSTVHSAKGLEWHSVFVIYVADGHIPAYQAFGNDDSIEEERRLFYVAMTRAKENLYLLRPVMDRSARSYAIGSGSVFTRVSRFLEEGNILEDYVDPNSSRFIEDFAY